MTRTTDADLLTLAGLINKATGNTHDFTIGHAYGGVRLERKGGSVDVSPRLSKGELRAWMHAFLEGIDFGTRNVSFVALAESQS